MTMDEERAFLSDAVPVNALPFLNRMMQILRENRANNFGSLPEKAKVDFRACLWVVLAQVYGQMANISMEGEWLRLSRLVNEGCVQDTEQFKKCVKEAKIGPEVMQILKAKRKGKGIHFGKEG
jgi:hypothetical protein